MAYTTATYRNHYHNTDGRLVLNVVFTGNAGEAPVLVEYPFDASTPPAANYFRGLAMAKIATLNNNLTFEANLPADGTVLDTTTPLPTPPVPTFGEYVAASAPFTPGATPQDVFTITGSATRAVTVIGMGLSTVQTSAGMNAWSLVKRSTANTGGTSATVAGVPTSDVYAAATAVVRQYTANPTLGTSLGSVWSGRVPSPAPATALAQTEKVLLETLASVALTGVADVLAWNLGGIALPSGLSVQAWVRWTETS